MFKVINSAETNRTLLKVGRVDWAAILERMLLSSRYIYYLNIIYYTGKHD